MLSALAPKLAPVTIVFDLDGTIADTAGDLVDAANAALVSEGLPEAPAETIEKAVGYGTKAMLRSGLSAIGREAEAGQMERLAAKLVAHYEENIARKTQLFPGFIEAATELRRHGAKLTLCTNKKERLARKLLSELAIETLFSAIAGGDTFPFHKPDPRHVTELVRLAGRQIAHSVMVGDSKADAAAAKSAGIPFLATTFGYASIPAADLGADALINHFEELPALVETLLLPGLSVALNF